MMSEATPRRAGWITLLLVLLPLWLVVSGGFAIWFYFYKEKRDAQEEQSRFAQTVSVPGLADDLRKIVEIIGERHGGSESAAKNLTRAASMIEGALGPANTGFTVRRVQGPAEWPLLQVTVKGLKPDSPAVWVLTSYDSRPGSPGAEANATGLASTLAAAQALAADEPAADIHFLFIPHANDPESPILETAAKFATIATAPKAVLCVEAMGAGEPLWLSSRDSNALPLAHVQGLGSVRGAEVVCLGDDVDFASILFESGIPAVRVSTRPLVAGQEADDQLPPAPVLAASTGRLVELIRRCVSAR
jgi:hypothetical protein